MNMVHNRGSYPVHTYPDSFLWLASLYFPCLSLKGSTAFNFVIFFFVLVFLSFFFFGLFPFTLTADDLRLCEDFAITNL